MKLLFLSYAYPPKKYPRSIQVSHLVNYLKTSLNIDVVTAVTIAGKDNTLLNFTNLDNVIQVRNSALTDFIATSRGHRLKKMLLPDSHYLWHFDLYDAVSQILENNGADIIVTFGQPMSSHITGLKLKSKFKHLKWIAHFSDPWVDNMFNDYNWWTRLINKYYQDKVFNTADKLIFTSDETINLVTSNYSYSIKSKSEYLPHCFNEGLYPSDNVGNKKFVISYLGNFYGDRQPDCLFKALEYLPADVLYSIKIDLIGAADVLIGSKIRTYGLDSVVSVVPSVDYLESLRLMCATDLLLIIDAPFENSPFLPSKLIDYIGANKPIFGITPKGTSQQLIEEMGFAVAHPNNPQDIAEKLFNMIKQVQAGNLKAVPDNIRNRYSVAVVGTQMKEILHEVSVQL